MTLAHELFVGVLANFVTALVLVLILAVCEFFFKRHKLFSFFGLTREKKLRIFVGHIAHENVPQGLVGFEECSAALRLGSLFNTVIPGLADKPGFLRYLRLADVTVSVESAPNNGAHVSLTGNVISLGAKSTNFASQLIEDDTRCKVRVAGQIDIPGLPPITNRAQAVVVKINRGNSVAFYLAGLDEPSTAMAARFVFENWNQMRRQYGDEESFCYLIERLNSGEIKVVLSQLLSDGL